MHGKHAEGSFVRGARPTKRESDKDEVCQGPCSEIHLDDHVVVELYPGWRVQAQAVRLYWQGSGGAGY